MTKEKVFLSSYLLSIEFWSSAVLSFSLSNMDFRSCLSSSAKYRWRCRSLSCVSTNFFFLRRLPEVSDTALASTVTGKASMEENQPQTVR